MRTLKTLRRNLREAQKQLEEMEKITTEKQKKKTTARDTMISLANTKKPQQTEAQIDQIKINI